VWSGGSWPVIFSGIVCETASLAQRGRDDGMSASAWQPTRLRRSSPPVQARTIPSGCVVCQRPRVKSGTSIGALRRAFERSLS